MKKDFISVANGEIITSHGRYNMNGIKTGSAYFMTQTSFCVEDKEKIYVTDRDYDRLRILNKSTGTELSSTQTPCQPSRITLMDNHVYIIMGFSSGDVICKYDVNGRYVSKQKFKGDPLISIKNYKKSIYVLCCSGSIIQLSSTGVVEKTIRFRGHGDDLAVYEDMIYICGDEGVNVYDMEGIFVKSVLSEPTYNMITHDDKLIMKTKNRISVYAVEYQ